MANIKKLFADAGVENAELMASIEQLVEAAESSKTDGIPESRFKQVIAERNELRADKSDLDQENSELKSKIEKMSDTIEEQKKFKIELDEFKHNQFKEQKSRWIDKSKIFQVEETDKLYDRINKIKDDFVLHDDESEYTEEEIAQNLKMIKPYEKINYFEDGYTPPDVDDEKSKGNQKRKTDYEDPYKVFDD